MSLCFGIKGSKLSIDIDASKKGNKEVDDGDISHIEYFDKSSRDIIFGLSRERVGHRYCLI